jgi:hypothetical protein
MNNSIIYAPALSLFFIIYVSEKKPWMMDECKVGRKDEGGV